MSRAKDPEYVAAYDTIHAQKLEANGNAELGHDFLMRPGDMVINSTWKYVVLLSWTGSCARFLMLALYII